MWRTRDNLPRHVKGAAWWHNNSRNPELTGYYYSTQDNNYTIKFLCVRGQEHWYSLTRKRTPTGKTYHTTDSSRRVPQHNTHGLGYWQQGDKSYYLEDNNNDYNPAKEPAQPEQTPIPTEEQEFLSGGLHHIATIKGKNPLHEWPLILLQAIAQHATAGGSFDTTTEPLAALEPMLSEIHRMSGPSANVQTTGNTNQNNGNGGAILGHAPEPFSGDRSASKAFLHQF